MNSIFPILHKILSEQFSFHSDQLELETQFELELGMDSREMLELFTVVESVFKIKINFDEIDYLIQQGEFLTVSDFVEYIKKKSYV